MLLGKAAVPFKVIYQLFLAWMGFWSYLRANIVVLNLAANLGPAKMNVWVTGSGLNPEVSPFEHSILDKS